MFYVGRNLQCLLPTCTCLKPANCIVSWVDLMDTIYLIRKNANGHFIPDQSPSFHSTVHPCPFSLHFRSDTLFMSTDLSESHQHLSPEVLEKLLRWWRFSCRSWSHLCKMLSPGNNGNLQYTLRLDPAIHFPLKVKLRGPQTRGTFKRNLNYFP